MTNTNNTATLDKLRPVIKSFHAEIGNLYSDDCQEKQIMIVYGDNIKNNISTNINEKEVGNNKFYRKINNKNRYLYSTYPQQHALFTQTIDFINIIPREMKRNYERLEGEYNYPNSFNIEECITKFYDGSVSIDLPNNFIGKVTFYPNFPLNPTKTTIHFVIRTILYQYSHSFIEKYYFSDDNIIKGKAYNKVSVNFVDY